MGQSTRRPDSPRHGSPVVAALALVALLAAACQEQPAGPLTSETPVQPGDRAPDFRLPAASGTEVSLDDYRGTRPVLLYFSMGPG
jgi:cytochrome oxidase Cu insertion factor (SCO1/SenC/PrrC family)